MVPKVLLVDDIDFFLEIEKDLLSRANVKILTARNGREALEVAQRERPDLIFMDVTMPVMDGLTCCRALKADSRLRDIPVVMVFAVSKDATPEDCMRAGCDGVLTKPIDRDHFLGLGRQFLQQIDRREARVPCRAQVMLRRSGREIAASAEDVSESGMYISSREEVACQEKISVFARFHGGTTSGEIMAQVVWLNQGEKRRNPSLPEGFGVKFFRPSASSKLIIEQMVRSFSQDTKRTGST